MPMSYDHGLMYHIHVLEVVCTHTQHQYQTDHLVHSGLARHARLPRVVGGGTTEPHVAHRNGRCTGPRYRTCPAYAGALARGPVA